MNSKKFFSDVIIVILAISCILVVFMGKMKEKAQIQKDQKLSSKSVSYSVPKPKENNFYDKIRNKQGVNFFVLGDEIAAQNNKSSTPEWLNNISKYLNSKYGVSVKIKDSLINGNTVFQGLNDCNRLSPKADIVIICLGQNDKDVTQIDQFTSMYENILINIKKNNKYSEIIPVIENTVDDGSKYSAAIKDLAKYYDLDCADTYLEFKNSNMPISSLTIDGKLPNEKGYSYYTGSIEKIIDDNIKNDKKIQTNVKSPMSQSAAEFNSMKFITDVYKNSGFQDVSGANVTNAASSSISYKINGDIAGISLRCGPDYGKIRVLLDGKYQKDIDCSSKDESDKNILVYDKIQKGDRIISIQSLDNKAVKIYGVISN